MKKLTIKYKKTFNRLLELTFKHNLSHLSSCLTTFPIVYEIYSRKEKDDIVILSNGHAGLAQYICMEAFDQCDAEQLLVKHGIHPTKDDHIFCSTGSLGLGLPIAIGAALANTSRTVHCIISDGECCEGSIWESLYFLNKNNIVNLKIYVNANGISAYSFVDVKNLKKIIKSFQVKNIKFIDTSNILKDHPTLGRLGIESHYIKIKDKQQLEEFKYEV